VSIKRVPAAGVVVALLFTGPALAAQPDPLSRSAVWSTAWATAPSSAERGTDQGYAGYTFRDVVHPTIGGDRVRLHLSNRFGTRPVFFGHVTVAVSAHAGGGRDGTVDPSDGWARRGTVRDVLFGGVPTLTVPAGAEAVSDPVDLAVAADHDLLVSIFTPLPSGPVTYHLVAKQDSLLTRGPADHAGDPAGNAFTELTRSWYYLSGLDVTGAPGTIVALGDSITDGVASTPGTDRRWTDYLAARLVDSPVPDYGVANSGISGNRLLLDSNDPGYSGYSRFGRSAQTRLSPDVLDRAGARTVIILEGINDIQASPHQIDPAQIIAGLAQLAARSHDRGLRVIGATIMAFQGVKTYTPELDAVRVAVNDWIRAGGNGAFDGVADFDLVTRDPADPARLQPALDCGDHLHPNDAGNAMMAAAVPLDRL
jgi:lysophospholipase L1-like esterase